MKGKSSLRKQMMCGMYTKEKKLPWSAETFYIQNRKPNIVSPQLLFLISLMYVNNDTTEEGSTEGRDLSGKKQCNEAAA